MCSRRARCFPGITVLENFRLALKFRGIEEANWRDRAMQSLSAVGMEQFANHYPKQLSVGMKQRINLARGICVGSEVLLLDEPFAALDEQTRMVLGEDLSILLARRGKPSCSSPIRWPKRCSSRTASS